MKIWKHPVITLLTNKQLTQYVKTAAYSCRNIFAPR